MSAHTATQSICLVVASIASVLLIGATGVHAAGAPRYPDIVEQISHLQIQNDVTGAPEGIYYLIHLADPENHWLETDEFNNFAWVKFSLRRRGANPKITILEQSACTRITCGSSSNP